MEMNFFAKWAKFFITKYKITLLLLLTLMGLGYYGLTTNQRQDFPPMTINYVFVSAVYPGADPETIAQEVLDPIVKELAANDKTLKLLK